LPERRPLWQWGGLFFVCLLLISCRARPPAVPTPCLGSLTIETVPSGAAILLDGAPLGQAPLTIALPPGTHRLRAEREGWEPAEEAVTGACDEARVTLTLRDGAPPEVSLNPIAAEVSPEEGLKVVATARDASGIRSLALFVDGQLATSTQEGSLRHNLDTRLLKPGEHRLVLRAVDGAGNVGEAEAPFTLRAPAVQTLAPTLIPTVAPTPTALPTAAPQPSATPSPTPQPTVESVAVSFGEMTLQAYAYEQALYTDPGAGHPYPLLRREQVGSPQERTFQTVVMRNAYLELTFLPELGGRLYSMRFLPTGQEVLYRNSRIKPTHWGPPDQGWWLAVGGMEWCLPVDEHGYVTAEPWEPTITRQADGSATVTMRILERSRNLEAEVAITLKPREAAIHVRPLIRNRDAEEKTFQFWVNAMVSPGKHGVGPDLRFFVPTSQVIVHSRGDTSLPDAHSALPWPMYHGRDLSRYSTWKNWLGFFAPQLDAPYTALYDEETQIGLVRAFPREIAQGAKIFAFGSGFDNALFSDDGAQYAEMWGGLTPTFWDNASLAGHSQVVWEEMWYPLAGVEGLTYANGEAALVVQVGANVARVTVAAPGEHEWNVIVLRGGREIGRQGISVRPDAPFRADFPLGNSEGQLAVQIVRQDGSLVASWAE